MRPFLTTLLTTLLAWNVQAQPSVACFLKYPVGETGCTVQMPNNPGEFDQSVSQDGSTVHVGEAHHEGYFFTAILVQFSEPLEPYSMEWEGVAMAYLKYLQQEFGIRRAKGYERAQGLDTQPGAVGVTDYWEDDQGVAYEVKAWCDPHFLCVLMVYGRGAYPHREGKEAFLNGFRFPVG